MRRIAIVGTGCCGKSTLARELSQSLGLTHVELDGLFWEKDWQQVPAEEFRSRVAKAVQAEQWIVDGNYAPVQPLILERATVIIWLDFSFCRIFSRAIRRTVSRVVTGERLFNGNRETFRDSFLSRHSILLWVIKSHPNLKRKYSRLFAQRPYGQAKFCRFASPGQLDVFVNQVTSRQP